MTTEIVNSFITPVETHRGSAPLPPLALLPLVLSVPIEPPTVPLPATPNWVARTRTLRRALPDAADDLRTAAHTLSLSQQEASRRLDLAMGSAPKVSDPDRWPLFQEWLIEVQTVRAETSGPQYATEAVLGAAATRFGLELEFAAADPDLVARRLYDLGLTNHPIMMPYHHVCPACQNSWKVERDGSVTEVVDGRNIGGEVVSPILSDSSEVWEQINLVAAIIAELGGQVNANTAQHVHVSTAHYRNAALYYRNLLVLVSAFEDLLYRLSAPGSLPHRGLQHGDQDAYHYAQPISDLLPGLPLDPNLSQVLEAVRCFETTEQGVSQAHYLAVNFQHVNLTDADKSRVEFRTFNGTLDPVQIQTNILLSAALVYAAQSDHLPAELRPLGWHKQHTAPTDDTANIRAFLDALCLPERAAKTVLDSYLRSQWQSRSRE